MKYMAIYKGDRLWYHFKTEEELERHRHKMKTIPGVTAVYFYVGDQYDETDLAHLSVYWKRKECEHEVDPSICNICRR